MLGAERLVERIVVLEDDRGVLTAAIRHMRRGRLDGRYLTDVLRAELAAASAAACCWKRIEVEIRCLSSS